MGKLAFGLLEEGEAVIGEVLLLLVDLQGPALASVPRLFWAKCGQDENHVASAWSHQGQECLQLLMVPATLNLKTTELQDLDQRIANQWLVSYFCMSTLNLRYLEAHQETYDLQHDVYLRRPARPGTCNHPASGSSSISLTHN